MRFKGIVSEQKLDEEKCVRVPFVNIYLIKILYVVYYQYFQLFFFLFSKRECNRSNKIR